MKEYVLFRVVLSWKYTLFADGYEFLSRYYVQIDVRFCQFRGLELPGDGVIFRLIHVSIYNKL